MAVKTTLIDVADTLLQKPAIFQVTEIKLKWWEKLLKKKTVRDFRIPPATLERMVMVTRELIHIDKELFDNDNKMEVMYNATIQHAERMAKIISLATFGDESHTEFFFKNISSADLYILVTLAIKQLNLSVFMTSITCAMGMKILDEKPVNP